MNSLQPPFSDIVGESSPVQKAIKMIWEIFANHPLPNNKSIASQSAAEQIVLHLLGTMNSIGMINAAGYHSAAVTLMRSIEDALDCLFAVVQSDEKGMCRLELNYQHAVISKNGYHIDRYLCIHLYELMDSLPLYYSEYFADKEERRKLFEKLKYDIETIIKDFLNSIGSDKLYMDTPPELEGLSNRK